MENYPGGDILLRLQQHWGDVQGPGMVITIIMMIHHLTLRLSSCPHLESSRSNWGITFPTTLLPTLPRITVHLFP